MKDVVQSAFNLYKERSSKSRYENRNGRESGNLKRNYETIFPFENA